ELAVEHTEALVMLGGHHGVAHTRGLCLAGPLTGVVEVGIEVLEIEVVMRLGYHLAHLNPLVAGGHRVQPPVDEHAEPVSGEPGGVLGQLARYIAGHIHFPAFRRYNHSIVDEARDWNEETIHLYGYSSSS